jgi:hypothetical protein
MALLIVLVIGLVIAVGFLTLSNIKMWIEFKAMKASTHQITYIDPLKSFANLTDEDKKKLQKDHLDDNL